MNDDTAPLAGSLAATPVPTGGSPACIADDDPGPGPVGDLAVVPAPDVDRGPSPDVAGDLDVDLSGDDVVVDLTGPVARVRHRPRMLGGVPLDEAWVLFAALVLLNAADVVTTGAVLAGGGGEGNPVVRPYVENGLGVVIVAKILVLTVVGYLLSHAPASKITHWALTATTGWYLAVVSWNLWVLAAL